MWFTETPWPPILIFSVAGVVCIVVWTSQRRRIALVGLMAMIVCSAATFAVEQQIVTEREVVEAVIHKLAANVKKLDRQATLDFISDAAPAWVKLDVRISMGLIAKIDRLRISDLAVTMKLENSRALTHFRANGRWSIKGYGDVGHSATRWRLTWQKESNEWKIIKLERLHPMNGKVMEMAGPD